ncbi:ABC transporter [Achromatium sp. WMS3]|nr:ABC transporter [Achromatium sp. WMS3]
MSQILIHDLCKSYPNRRKKQRINTDETPYEPIAVLDHVNIKVSPGHLTCILGPSGCGKSTLLMIVAGFDKPTSGKVLINNKPITGPTSDNMFVFQQGGLFPWLTVAQNVELGLRNLQDQKEKWDKIYEAIKMVGLKGFEDHYPEQLSGGMKRRAELARALVVNPKLLIMDEPFSGLDFLTHLRMREEVVNMHELCHQTILIVTHDIDDAIAIGDHLIVMTDRPSRVKMEHIIEPGHPRNYEKDKEIAELREEIFFTLGVHYAV